MIFMLRLNPWIVRLVVLLTASAGCFALARVAQGHYLIGMLNDQGAKADLESLQQAVQRLPHSARLQGQLAAAALTQANDFDESLTLAETAARQAVQLSPHNADFRLLLAATQTVSGDLASREEHLRAAVALAPHYPQVRWQLANLLVRAGKLNEAASEFRQVAAAQPTLLPSALDLLWEAAGGDLNVVMQAAGETPRNQLTLAGFLFQQGRTQEAAQVFSRIEAQTKANAPEAADFLNRLLNAGQPETARRLWGEIRGATAQPSAFIWNGGFETEPLPKLPQFDWQFKRSEYASAKIEQSVARTGQRALQVEFFGRDTTKLTDEIKQLIVLRPDTPYRLTCYAKAAQFTAPEGPRWAVLNYASAQPVAVTNPVQVENQSDWQTLAADFTTAASQTMYWLALQRTPKFSYDEPTKGALWFDDCSLEELARPPKR